MSVLQRVSEGLARKTSRRSFFGRGADVAFGALAGAAAGTLSRAGGVSAGGGTVCIFPGNPCACDKCQTNGVCAKPCIILTTYYTSGCWTDGPGGSITCCDCNCHGLDDFYGSSPTPNCGCGSDFHNNSANCP
jgi:hypothetical protein